MTAVSDTVKALACTVLLASATVLAGRAQQGSVPQAPGVYAETDAGTVPLKKTLRGIEIAGSMSTSRNTRALVFPISTLDGVPASASVASFVVNLATVQDTAAANAQMRFTIGDHVREPDYQTMSVVVGKFRTGTYRISSPQLTNEWLSSAYAKLTNSRKWRDKHPPAVVGLILNDEMYPVRIDEAVLTTKR